MENSSVSSNSRINTQSNIQNLAESQKLNNWKGRSVNKSNEWIPAKLPEVTVRSGDERIPQARIEKSNAFATFFKNFFANLRSDKKSEQAATPVIGKRLELLKDKQFVQENPEIAARILNQASDKLNDIDSLIKSMLKELPPKTSSAIAKALISKEMEKSKDIGTLLRQDSVAAKFITQFQHQAFAAAKKKSFPSIIRSNIKQNIIPKEQGDKSLSSLELDEKIQKKLINKAVGTLKSVEKMTQKEVPSYLKEVYQHLHNEAETKFPGEGNKQVLSMFFLRFANPTLLSPDSLGVSKEKYSGAEGLNARFITKTLMNIANETIPGAKESYMKFMTSTIEAESTQQIKQNILNNLLGNK